jgi:hypothetical protein
MNRFETDSKHVRSSICSVPYHVPYNAIETGTEIVEEPLLHAFPNVRSTFVHSTQLT